MWSTFHEGETQTSPLEFIFRDEVTRMVASPEDKIMEIMSDTMMTVLVGENVFARENGSVEPRAAVSREAFFDNVFDMCAAEHLCGTVVPRALGIIYVGFVAY